MRTLKIIIILNLFFCSCRQKPQTATEKLIDNLDKIDTSKTADTTQIREIVKSLKGVLTAKDYYPTWRTFYLKEYNIQTKFPVKPRIDNIQKAIGDTAINFTKYAVTDKDANILIASYSILAAKLPTYSLTQLETLFEKVRQTVINEYGTIKSETRVFKSFKDPINSYEYFIDKDNKLKQETYIRVTYSFGLFVWEFISGKEGQERIEDQRDFLNCTKLDVDSSFLMNKSLKGK